MPLKKFNATDSYLGYIFQGLYALIVLLEADDDHCVSIETDDDVVLQGDEPTLYQLKHSLSSPPPLSEKSDALWKTIRIWSSLENLQNFKFILVTCAPIKERSFLNDLSSFEGERSKALIKLESEARDVLQKVKEARERNDHDEPCKIRLKGCKAFLNLSASHRKHLVDNLLIRPSSFNISEIDAQICLRLKNVVRPEKRKFMTEKLIEWWDGLVVRSLLKKRLRQICKLELQNKISELIQEFSERSLPDFYSQKKPASLDSERGGMMERQIELVDGGEERIKRAAIARWRARNQRFKWLDYDVSLSDTLGNYDKTLIEAWQGHHEPMKHDYKNDSETAKQEVGRKLLDWTHHKASIEIPAPRPEWSQPFYTQGMFQQLAEELTVGWHPEFYERLSKTLDGKGDTE